MIEAETIQRLVRLPPDGPPVLSLYVNVDAADRRQIDSQVSSLLDRVRPLAHDDSLDREARLSVRADIAQVERSYAAQRWQPGARGIFSSSARGVFEEVVLPRAVHDQVVVDSTPWVRPMLAVLDEYHRACVVVIDKAATRVFELYQDEMREATAFRDPRLRSPSHSYGRVENRVHNKADELAKRHYRRTVEVLDHLARTGGFEVLVIGGKEYEVPAFLEFLPRDLRTRVAGTFAVDASSAALGDIQALAEGVLRQYERDEEIRMVTETLELNAMGGLAAVGLSDCLWAGSVSAIQSLLIQEGVIVPGVVCHESRWLGESGATCPLCNGPTESVPDVADELVTAVIEDGGSIEHVSAETDLTRLIVAAQLRFPLPPRP